MRAPLRIAQLANFVAPTSGGLRVVVEELARDHLAAGGARLSVVPGRVHSRCGDDLDRRVTVPGWRLPASAGGYRLLWNRRPVLAELAAFAPDLVEVHDQTTLTWAGRWARGAGVPSVLFCHERLDHVLSRVTGVPPEGLQGLARRRARRLVDRFDVVVCASEFAAEPFRAAGARQLRVIPFGVDLAQFRPRPRSDGPPWPPHSRRLILAGRLSVEKEPEIALEVLARLRAARLAVHLVVLGDGPLGPRLRRQVHAERLPVTFLGHVAHRGQVARLLAGADVALAPGRCETFGLGVLEALACGTPVVVGAGGAASELLRPGAGAAVDGAAAMARAVAGLLTDPGAATRARACAEQFPWSATWSAMSRLRGELVALHSSPRRQGRRVAAARSGRRGAVEG